MPLRLTNSLTRKKESFVPVVPGHAGVYVCGPTVYSDSHVGHAKSYVSFDVLVRYLRWTGLKVLYVQNITDVGHLLDDGEDRMLKQSRLQKVHPMQIAETITRSYFDDMDALNVLRPDISPRASGHITEQIAIVEELIARKHAYEVDGSVYFDVRSFPAYGRLSGRTLEDAVGGTRVEARSDKRNPEDFALWKKAGPEHIMRWPSPWGEGFPGWHVECSAMSMKYLGEEFDIHGGGLDNQFPHHECELAQSVAATGTSFARMWVHNNLVTVNGKKMSKSLGNFVTLKDLFARYDPLVVRFFILQSHYRGTLDFSEAALDGARTGYERLRNTLDAARRHREDGGPSGSPGLDAGTVIQRMTEALDDDLNTPQAIAVLFDFAKDLNTRLASDQGLSGGDAEAVEKVFQGPGEAVLGLFPDRRLPQQSDGLDEKAVDALVALRRDAKGKKDFALADRIRELLVGIGVVLEDSKDGTTWKRSH